MIRIVSALALLLSATTAWADANAARLTATTAPNCQALGDFYWEIGDRNGPLVQGASGPRYAADTSMAIASASKWVWGAFVLQDPAQPTDATRQSLRMLSGYTHLNPLRCLLRRTVRACFEAGDNSQRDPAEIGVFHYNGGHDQKLALDLGYGDANAAALTRQVRERLHLDPAFEYDHPQPAGGLRATPAAYAHFLQAILRKELRLADFLGKDAVCTAPPQCAAAPASPAPAGWRYSYNHWVEVDGSFSSPGLEGFYPWISADRTRYGLVARQSLHRKAYLESAACGAAIRRADSP